MENQKLNFIRHYQTDIYLGEDLFPEIAGKFNISGLPRDCVIITNENVGNLYLKDLTEALKAKNIKTTPIIIKDGECFKNFETVNNIIQQLAGQHIDRSCPIIGLGGGVVCDISGFVASTYKRGTPLILVPTSLLAMVDASFGGKNAINTDSAKNLIGTFYHPIMTFVNISVLKSLPLSQMYYGLVEAIKHGLIYDFAYFNFIINNLDEIKKFNLPILQRIIRRSIFIKREFVTNDELDNGKRGHLNFGHTFGHGIETAGDYRRYNHAEAVGLGMLMAIKASVKLGILKENYFKMLESLLKELDLPTQISSEVSIDKLIQAIQSDKKRNNDFIKFILPENLGKTIVYKVKANEIDRFVRDALV